MIILIHKQYKENRQEIINSIRMYFTVDNVRLTDTKLKYIQELKKIEEMMVKEGWGKFSNFDFKSS